MSKKKYFKDGNPDVFRSFNEFCWKNMTDEEKSHWTPFSEVDLAPIPREVIEFNKKVADHLDKVKVVHEEFPINVKSPKKETEEKNIIREKLGKLGIEFAYNSTLETLQKKLADCVDKAGVVDELDTSGPVNKELEAVRAELTRRGIKFTWNTKLETLNKKLAKALEDATDSE